METNSTISIQDIHYFAGSGEINISGKIVKNSLSYPSQITIDSTQLNQIINALQVENPLEEVASMFDSRISEDGAYFYFLNCASLAHNEISLEKLESTQSLLKIRA